MMQNHEPHFSRSTCPVDQLEWFVNHTLPASEQATIEAHLAGCAFCQAEVRNLTELQQALQTASAHTPEPRADLFMQIEQQLDLQSEVSPRLSLLRLFQTGWFALSVCGEHFRAQARLIRRDLFWMPLLIVPLAVSLVYLPAVWQRMPGPVALLAALLTALGMAFLYGQRVDPLREITLVTQTSPRLVLGIRCCLVFGYDLLLNCALILPLLASQGIVTPAWFLANWLAPLVCLSAIALLLSILANASIAVGVCTSLWGLRILNDVQAIPVGSPLAFPLALGLKPYEAFWHQGPLLFGIALLAIGGIFFFFFLIEPSEDVVYFSYRAAVVPASLQGRIIGASRILTRTTSACSPFLAGLMLEKVGATWTIVIYGVYLLLGTAVLSLSPHIRHARMPVGEEH